MSKFLKTVLRSVIWWFCLQLCLLLSQQKKTQMFSNHETTRLFGGNLLHKVSASACATDSIVKRNKGGGWRVESVH